MPKIIWPDGRSVGNRYFSFLLFYPLVSICLSPVPWAPRRWRNRRFGSSTSTETVEGREEEEEKRWATILFLVRPFFPPPPSKNNWGKCRRRSLGLCRSVRLSSSFCGFHELSLPLPPFSPFVFLLLLFLISSPPLTAASTSTSRSFCVTQKSFFLLIMRGFILPA